MNLDLQKAIRLYELDKVLPYVAPNHATVIKLLEIGAGTGWQACELSKRGLEVEAIDLIDSNYARARVFNVIDYDGRHIPFPDHYFDIVFSSNVLEHIPHLSEFQNEIHRVLKPNGHAVHVVPSCYWRFWSNFTHYIELARQSPALFREFCAQLFRLLFRPTKSKSIERKQLLMDKDPRASFRSYLIFCLKLLFPHRHGETGNALSEIYYFSAFHWRNLFVSSHWIIETHFKNQLFYTGSKALGRLLSIEFRRKLSYLLGSSSYTFVLRKNTSK